ncbi:hypothetical protein [Paenibacillus flagellatus]|uniref:Uncharacterized protein n=1 Tax=Paenibacillus flagellatus TaxID=2211139 RepID=A0A2V5KGC8_9BACL|nr:hypothetical protein [Paenibacillus flagellatus]PYI57363.1 hypothetical protein DLM86_02690 [Paenibacillus flagellatus]
MRLLTYELYKTFRPAVVLVSLAVLLTMSAFALGYPFSAESEKRAYDEWGGPLTEEKVRKAGDEAAELLRKRGRDDESVLSESELLRLSVYRHIALAQSLERDTADRLRELEVDTGKAAGLEKRMRERIGPPSIAYHTGPAQTVGFVEFGSYVVLGAMVLIGLAPMYTREYASGVDHYLLSSKKGRGAAVWAKLGASLLYTAIVVAVWEAFNVVWNVVRHGREGWDTPIQLLMQHSEVPYADSPYALTLLQYHFIQLAVHLAGAIGFSIFVVLVSSVCRSSLVSFVVSGAVFAVPIFLEHAPWFAAIKPFTYSSMLRVQFLFDGFKAVPLFGYPVLYPVFAVILIIVTTLLCVAALFRIMKQKEAAA